MRLCTSAPPPDPLCLTQDCPHYKMAQPPPFWPNWVGPSALFPLHHIQLSFCVSKGPNFILWMELTGKFDVLWSSGVGWKSGALIWDTARKMKVFPLFSIVSRILQLLITLELLVWFRLGFHQNIRYLSK